MATLREFLLDRWSNLSHKKPMRDDPASTAEATRQGWAPNTWVGPEHARRLQGYTVLSAYVSNVSRHFLDTDDDADVDERREYGDAALIVDTVMSAVLGETQQVLVPGAENHDPDLGAAPEPAEGQDPPAEAPSEEDLAANEEAGRLAERQAFLQQWARDVHLSLRLVDNERNTVQSGDGVLLVMWDSVKQRVVPAVMDPGFYFPVLPDTLDAYEYPTRVHFAWELPGEDFGDGKARVRRITYDLVNLAPILPDGPDALLMTDEEFDAAITLPVDAEWVELEDGQMVVMRTYPWDTDPSRKVCVMTDATWVLDDLDNPQNLDSFTFDEADIAVDAEGNELLEYDLGIDFVPVVHVPNTPPGGEHFGESSIARVLQVLDDLQNSDTDSAAASATTGSPILWTSQSKAGDNPLTGIRAGEGRQMKIKPGARWDLGENGQAGSIDTSSNLAALREHVTKLLDRLATNSRLPGALLGTVKPSEVPSGYAMALSFGPLKSMIGQMRLVRSVKYPLLLKMVQRLYQANGVLDAGPTIDATIQLGAYLPTDLQAALDMVVAGVDGNVISLETGVRMLAEAGFPIDDVAEEVEAITARDFTGANGLVDVTGDVNDGRKYLGLDPTTPKVTDVPILPAPTPPVPPVPQP